MVNNTTNTQITSTISRIMSESKKECIGCAEEITGVVKISLPCRHEYCDKCVDKIIIKSTGNLKCFVCEPNDIETGNCCVEFCDKYYESCNSFLKIFCWSGTCFNDEFVKTVIGIFIMVSCLFTISSIPLGITMLLKYGSDYNNIINNFIITSIVCNGCYCIFMLRLASIIREIETENMPACCIFLFSFLIMHVLLLSIGSYNLSHYFDHNEVVIVFVVTNCLNICKLGFAITLCRLNS